MDGLVNNPPIYVPEQSSPEPWPKPKPTSKPGPKRPLRADECGQEEDGMRLTIKHII